MKRICKLCGKVFDAKSSRRSFCYEAHYHPCPICGKDVLTIDLYHLNTCCCGQHSRMLAANTVHERFPNNEHIDNPESNAKRNAKNPFLTKTGQAYAKQRVKELYGVDCVLQLDSVRDAGKETSRKRYGADSWMQSDMGKSTMQTIIQTKYNDLSLKSTLQLDDVKAKCDITNLERYATTIPMQNRKVWAKQRASNKSRYVASDGTTLDSTYEISVYEYCLRNNLPVECNVPIKYAYEGVEHTTYIDFRISDQLFEVKGEHILDGYFDDRGVPIAVKLDVYKHNDVVVITGSSKSNMFGKPNSTTSNGLKYKHKCPYPLIGVDIELFDNPEFPYRDDRPKCFYDVRVDGQPSAFEAFQDEKLRWKMILNRIQYSGGFIDAHQVLNAFNITRTCKQPSWFSKSLAKHIISDYCSSDTIVDPFAGWGARADAANELQRTYIGCDFNEELVAWHHSKGRTNIQYGDANEFKFEGKCSVFICPPYSDPDTGRCFEDYNFDGFDASAKAITQCQWLQIVMNNVPNAEEYIMVCKIVDPGWEQYVVDTKVNKSHFGINNEYVLVVKP